MGPTAKDAIGVNPGEVGGRDSQVLGWGESWDLHEILLSITYFFRLIPQVAENGAAREPCQRRRPTPKAEGLRRRLAGGRSPQGGREGGDSRERCCQSPVRGE